MVFVTSSAEEYFQCVDVARTTCERVSAFFQLSLERYQVRLV
jgi:hypothetical protein